MKKYIAPLAIVAGLLITTAASCDRGARKDLPQDNQALDHSEATVYLFPDKYPNMAHKCDGTTGMWTTTDRAVWVIYDDVLCGGTQGGLILSNIPGQRQTDPSGEEGEG